MSPPEAALNAPAPTPAARDYTEHRALRDRVHTALAALADAYDDIGGHERARALRAACDHLGQDAFRLMVVGEFKRGKSTLINALLGADVLPAKVAPCTSAITEVRRGDPPAATIHWADAARAPETVGLERLRELVVIADDDDDDDAEAAPVASPYSRIEVAWPRLPAEDLVIVDSPGLNEHAARTRLALDHLATADALMLVLSCQQPLTRSELDFLDRDLAGRNLRHVFFVWNHLDALDDDPAALAELERVSAERLAARAGTDARIFFVSARRALAGRLRADPGLVAQSGVPELEAALEAFLATERGRAKLLAPLRTAERACREALAEALPTREALLQAPLAELDRRREAEKPRIEALKRQRTDAVVALERRRDALREEIGAAYEAFVAEAEAALPAAVAGAPVGAWETIVSQRRAREGVAEHLRGWLEARLDAWREGPLKVVVDRHAAALEVELTDRARSFGAALDDLDATTPEVLPRDGADTADVAAGERLLTAVGGFLVGGPGAAIEGATLGWRGLTRGLVVHVGLGMALVAFGVGGPLVLPLLAAVGAGRAMWEATSVVDELRARVAEGLAERLRRGIPEVVRESGRRVEQAYARVAAGLDAEMAALIDEAEGRLTSIREARAAGETEVAAARQGLAAVRTRVEAAGRELEAVRFVLEGA